MSAKIKKIVLAYSGGLDTSIILKWLQEAYQAEVVAYIADVGQGEELEAARVKALNTGAVEAIVGDLKEEFVRDFVFPAMRANAIYEGSYLLGTSVARPIIAKGMIEALRWPSTRPAVAASTSTVRTLPSFTTCAPST